MRRSKPRSGSRDAKRDYAEAYQRTTAQWVGARDLLGHQPSWQLVADLLSDLSLLEVLEIIGRISAVLRNGDGFAPRTQMSLCAGVMGAASTEIIGRRLELRLVRDRRDASHPQVKYVLFGERALRMLVQIAVYSCVVPPPQAGDKREYRKIGEAILVVNDLILMSPNEPGEAGAQSEEEKRKWTYYLWLATEQGGQPPVHSMAWALALFLSDHPEHSQAESYIDLRELFRNTTGLDSSAYAMAALQFLGPLYNIKAENCHDRTAAFSTAMFRGGEALFSEAEQSQFFDLAGLQSGAFIDLAKRTYPEGVVQAYLHLPLEASPVVRFESLAVCASFPLLEEKLTFGLYHSLFNAPATQKSDGSRKRFHRYIGVVFEGEALRSFEGTLRTQSRARKGGRATEIGRLICEAELKKCIGGNEREGMKLCDAILVTGHSVMFIECKAWMLPLEARSGGNEALFFERLDSLVDRAGSQLHSTVRAFLAGAFASIGLTSATVSRAECVLVSLQNWRMTNLLYDHVQSRLVAKGLIVPRIVDGVAFGALEMLSPADLDWLEGACALSGRTAASILAQKADDPIGRSMSLVNWGLFRDAVRGAGTTNLARHAAAYEGLSTGAIDFYRSHVVK